MKERIVFILKLISVIIFVIFVFFVGITLWVNEMWLAFTLYAGALFYFIGCIIDDLED